MVVAETVPSSHYDGVGVGASKGRGVAAARAKMVSRRAKPFVVVHGDVTTVSRVTWLGLVAREVAGMSWEENNLSKSDTVLFRW
jgi:hypothetical protein